MSALGLPCLIGRCATREHCETTPTPDPWDGADVMWPKCPGLVSNEDVEDALMVRGLSKMAPLSDWPHGYAARIPMTWAEIESVRGGTDG